MEISLSSVLSSIVSTSLLTILLFWFIQHRNMVNRFGLRCMYLLILFILCRGFLPVDFSYIGFTNAIYSRRMLPWLRDFLLIDFFSIHGFSVTPGKVLLTIWLTGSLISASQMLRGHIELRRILKSSPQIIDSRITSILQRALDITYPKHRIPTFRLIYSDVFSSPAVYGVLHPIIILPHLRYSDEEFCYVFRHELLHYRHKDYLFKAFANVMSLVYWWNPLLSRLLLFLTAQVQELWVDHCISEGSNKGERIQYMKTLVSTLKKNKKDKSSQAFDKQMLSFAHTDDSDSIRQRFSYIMQENVKSFSFLGIVLCVAIFLFSFRFVFEPVYSPSTDENGTPVYRDVEEQTYFIKNGIEYDIYMEGSYVGTLSSIPTTFQDAPVYDSREEVLEVKNHSKIFFYPILVAVLLLFAVPVCTKAETMDDTTTVSPQADLIDWQYKYENGTLYRRLYNYSTNTPVGSWELVP